MPFMATRVARVEPVHMSTVLQEVAERVFRVLTIRQYLLVLPMAGMDTVARFPAQTAGMVAVVRDIVRINRMLLTAEPVVAVAMGSRAQMDKVVADAVASLAAVVSSSFVFVMVQVCGKRSLMAERAV